MRNITLEQLLEEYIDGEHIPYSEYLQTYEWNQKRNEILERDLYKCQTCDIDWNPFTIEIGGDGEKDDFSLYKIKGKWVNEQEYKKWVDEFKNEPNNSFNIHHKLYYKNRLPWKYDNSELITLCSDCHIKFHRENKIHVYNESNNIMPGFKVCDRCNGAGYFPQFRKIEQGICFKCRGERFNFKLIEKK